MFQLWRAYAFPMPEPAQVAPYTSRNSFADLLASITGKLQSDGWDDSGLANDVSTISYEQALRAARHGRMPVEMSNRKVAGDGDEAVKGGSRVVRTVVSGEKVRKGASVTIRITAEEQSQLQERAAAANLSVSAYLRSCIFEAEALRAEVKGALAQLQSAHASASGSTAGRWRWRLPSAWRRGRTADR